MLHVYKNEPMSICISGDLIVSEACSLYTALAKLKLDTEGEVVVDLQKVVAMDASGMQILLAFRRHLGSERVNFHNLPAHILDTLKLGGMDGYFR